MNEQVRLLVAEDNDYTPNNEPARFSAAVQRSVREGAVKRIEPPPERPMRERTNVDQEHQAVRALRLTGTYRMLSATSSAILRLRNRSDLLDEVCRIAVCQGSYDRVAISLMDPNANLQRLRSWAADKAQVLSSKDCSTVEWEPECQAELVSIENRTMQARAPTICNDLNVERSSTLPCKGLFARGFRGLATLPILAGGIAIGAVTFWSDRPGIFDAEEVVILEELAANLAYALQSLENGAVHLPSYFDNLTGLPTRALFCQSLAQPIGADDPQNPQPLQVVVFDIQKLHAINDFFGRYVGDRLIECVAARLKKTHADPQVLAYFGGGTFALVLPGSADPVDPGAGLHDSIGRLFVEPIHINGHEFRPSLRYGIAHYPDHGTSAGMLVQCAETSLVCAREEHEKYRAYTSIAHRRENRQLALESRLVSALERDEFLLHYQPKIDLASGSVEGFEALLRWQDSEVGLVPANLFIPMLERSGALVDVGAWVLLQAAHDIHLWRMMGLPNIRVAVNVSASQLRRRDFVAQILSCVGSSRVPTGIDIELNESMLMQDSELATRKLAQLREAGVGVALDHFGTSSCSLPLLAGLPVSALKIDRSFVQRAGDSKKGARLVSTIISLARSLGIQTIAEGVETAQQLQTLRQMNCDQAQGYFMGRPGPVSEVSSVIARPPEPFVAAQCA